jgi:hypothetical protein
MMPNPKSEDRGLLQRRGAKGGHLFENLAQALAALPGEELLHCLGTDHRQWNPPADAIDGQKQERQQNLLPQLRNREDDANFFPHGRLPRVEEFLVLASVTPWRRLAS